MKPSDSHDSPFFLAFWGFVFRRGYSLLDGFRRDWFVGFSSVDMQRLCGIANNVIHPPKLCHAFSTLVPFHTARLRYTYVHCFPTNKTLFFFVENNRSALTGIIILASNYAVLFQKQEKITRFYTKNATKPHCFPVLIMA